jgi:hypothetical protein
VFSHTSIDEGCAIEIRYLEFGSPISAKQFFTRLNDKTFAIDFSKRLASQPVTAGFWECPAYSEGSANEPFKCVLINAPELAEASADSTAFRRKLVGVAYDQSGVFPNLNNSATLISPQAKPADYSHLLSFVRKAQPRQIINFWATVSRVVLEKTSSEPLWISTSGRGVPWLHVRLDTQPKYYRHLPYITHSETADE